MLSLVADVHCAWHTEISRDRGGLPLLRKEKTAFSGEFAKLRMSEGSEYCIMQTGMSFQIVILKRSEAEFCDVLCRILRTGQKSSRQTARHILRSSRVRADAHHQWRKNALHARCVPVWMSGVMCGPRSLGRTLVRMGPRPARLRALR